MSKRALLGALAILWLAAAAPGASASDSARSLTDEQKGWALATSAMLFQRNMDSHDLLAGAPRTDWYVDRTRELLNDWWGIRTRAELMSTLRWLAAEGHRADFERLGAVVDRLPPRLVGSAGTPVATSPCAAGATRPASSRRTRRGGASCPRPGSFRATSAHGTSWGRTT